MEALVPYRGPVSVIFEELAQNIRSGFSYSGAKNIQEMRVKAKFIRQTSLGMKESGTHIANVSR